MSASITGAQPLLSFSTISRFIIPRQSLCGNLISIRPPPPTPQTPPVLVLSYPICISSSHYPRNEFIFNFALVLDDSPTSTTTQHHHQHTTPQAPQFPTPNSPIDIPAYKSVLTKFAQLMQLLETQSHFLSSDTSSAPNTGKIHALCETFMEDLNNYRECMIPLDELNTLNVKLFPTLPNPPSLKSYHVPLLTVHISTLMDENWDLTLQRIIPHVDGVRSVKKIALRADADLKLTKKAIKHLLYYGCLLLLDIFSFNAIYAPTAEFGDTIVKEEGMQRECARYVNTAFAPPSSGNSGRRARNSANASTVGTATGEVALSTSTSDRRHHAHSHSASVGASYPSHAPSSPFPSFTSQQIWPLTGEGRPIDGPTIVQLYANLRQGLTVREWYLLNENLLASVDLRRFITFGVIKGFLYRVHRYVFLTGGKREDRVRNGVSREGQQVKDIVLQHSDTDSDRGAARMTNGSHSARSYISDAVFARKIRPFLDGTHCLDEICTELEISEREVLERLNSCREGEVVVICR